MIEEEIKQGFQFSALLEDSPEHEERLASYEEMQRKIEEEKKQKIFEDSGVPMKFYKTRITDWKAETDEEKEIIKKIYDFINDPENKVYLLFGNNGTGKSMLAAAIIRELGGLYRNSSAICIEYESSSDYRAEETKLSILKKYTTNKLLVIDECGKYTLKPDVEKFLLSYIVNNRYENNLPTILITNTDKRTIVEFMGRATFDRLREVCISIQFTGESRR